MSVIKVSYIGGDFAPDDFENEIWQNAAEVRLDHYWSGVSAELARRATARLVWTTRDFIIRFEGTQREPLIVNSKPDLTKKAMKLWELDVFEIFVAPDGNKFNNYYEFEVAPTGEWLDAKLEILPDGERKTNFAYISGMRASAEVFENKVSAMIRIPWTALGKKPQTGEIWRGNLFRCIGSGKNRGYLAWQPTKTIVPNFHVPEAFGQFEFVKK